MRASRLRSVQQRISRFPYRHDAIDKAYANFLDDGSLPEDCALAGAVLKRVLNARKQSKELDACRLDQIASGAIRQPYGTTREMLFREAVCEEKSVRYLARLLLTALVRAGHDPTDPEIIGPEMEPENYATITMQLLGWPTAFVSPQYEAQLQRVLRQRAEVRAQRSVDAEWDRGAARAVAAFLKHGQVPTDQRYFLYVLTTGEMFALNGHYFGQGGEDLLAAFEAVATSSGEERVAALQHLGKLQVQATEARA